MSGVVFFFGILTFLIITRESRLIRDIYHEESANASHLVVEHLRELMIDNRPEGIVKYIQDVNKDTRMKVGIYGREGKPAFGTDIQAPATGAAGQAETFIRTKDDLIFYRPLQNTENCRSCHAPEYAFIGTVVVKHSVQKMEEAIRGTVRQILIFALFLGITSEIFLLIIVRKMILKPVEEISRGAQTLMGGKKLDHRIEQKSDDEIGSLVSCFNEMADSLERSRSNLETAVNQKTKELRVIAELTTSVFKGNMALEDIIGEVLTTITAHMGFRYAALCLIDRETGFLSQEYSRGLSTDICSIETSLASRHPLMALIRNSRIAIRNAADIEVPDEFGKVVVIPLLSQQRKRCQDITLCTLKDCPAFSNPDDRCWLIQGTLCCSPIAVAGPDKIYGCLHCEAFPVIGVLLMGRNEEITKTSVHSLEILASGVTSAIENRRFIEGKKEDISNLVMLHDMSTDVLQSLDIRRLTESIVSSAISLAKMDAAILWLKGTDGRLNFERGAGLDESRVPPSIPVDGTFTGRSVIERQLIETVKISEAPCLRDLLKHHAFLYAASIPLMHEGEVFGCLTLFKKRDFLMTDSETAIIGLFSGQASAAINAARLYRSLDKSEKRYKELVETAQDAIFTISPEGIFTSLNRAFESITGWSREEWLGNNFAPLINPDDLAFAASISQQVLQGEVPPLFELRVSSKSGEYQIIELRVVPQHYGNEVTGLMGIGRNVTARRKMEQALHAEKEFSDAIFNNMIMGVMVIDRNGKIVRLNRAGAGILKVGYQEMTDERLSEVLPEITDFLLISNDRSREVYVGQGEQRVPIGFNSSPLLDPEGSPIATIVVFRDLSEIKKLRAEIKRKEHFESMGKVLSGVAHEVRNPLFGISAIAQILEREVVSEQHQALVKALLKEAARMKNLIDELLLYSRPARLNIREIDLGILLEEIKYSLHGKRNEIQISVQLPPLFIIRADAEKITQVFLNLLNNAMAAAVTTVKISAHISAAGGAEIKIEDDGPGIPAEHLDKIFDPFFTTKTGGTGLGLPICKKIVEDHGGEISVKTEPGRGTEVAVNLRA